MELRNGMGSPEGLDFLVFVARHEGFFLFLCASDQTCFISYFCILFNFNEFPMCACRADRGESLEFLRAKHKKFGHRDSHFLTQCFLKPMSPVYGSLCKCFHRGVPGTASRLTCAALEQDLTSSISLRCRGLMELKLQGPPRVRSSSSRINLAASRASSAKAVFSVLKVL